MKLRGSRPAQGHHLGTPFGPDPSDTSVMAASPTPVNASINVDDSNGGSWPFSDDGSVDYNETFDCDADEGTHNNTATIRETLQSDDASVEVECYSPSVTKDAKTALDRTYGWSIDKSADKSSLTLAPGQTSSVNYTGGRHEQRLDRRQLGRQRQDHSLQPGPDRRNDHRGQGPDLRRRRPGDGGLRGDVPLHDPGRRDARMHVPRAPCPTRPAAPTRRPRRCRTMHTTRAESRPRTAPPTSRASPRSSSPTRP